MIGFHIKETLRGLAVLLFFAALILVGLRIMAGCTPRDTLPVENALAVKQYDDALVECQQAARQKPREQRFEAYADCEQNVSKALCDASSELREHWTRCAELDR